MLFANYRNWKHWLPGILQTLEFGLDFGFSRSVTRLSFIKTLTINSINNVILIIFVCFSVYTFIRVLICLSNVSPPGVVLCMGTPLLETSHCV